MTQAFRNFRGGSSAWEQVGPGDDLKPENVSYPASYSLDAASDIHAVQAPNAKARASQRGRAKEIEGLEHLDCIYLRMNVIVQHPMAHNVYPLL